VAPFPITQCQNSRYKCSLHLVSSPFPSALPKFIGYGEWSHGLQEGYSLKEVMHSPGWAILTLFPTLLLRVQVVLSRSYPLVLALGQHHLTRCQVKSHPILHGISSTSLANICCCNGIRQELWQGLKLHLTSPSDTEFMFLLQLEQVIA